MDDYTNKIDRNLFDLIQNIENPAILELGVQNGLSTKKFIDICNKNNGFLYSVDVDDCSKVSNDKRWTFIKSRDDDFSLIKSKIPKEIDILYIDSLHEADHVSKIIYGYYNLIKTGGFIFIDDISHLPYQKNRVRDNFYCEINNKETFDILLSIYSENFENFDLSFSFISSGLAIIKKKNDKDLIMNKILTNRSVSLKNSLRKIWRKIKKG